MALANLPDIDFLPGYLAGKPNLYHHYHTHSLGFAAIVGALAGLFYWHTRGKFWPYFTLVFAAVSSHLLLDLLTADEAPPYGMALFWPLSPQFYDLPWDVFGAVHKSDSSHDFFPSLFHSMNLRVMLLELAILLPLAAFVRALKSYNASSRRASARGLTQATRGLVTTAELPALEAMASDSPMARPQGERVKKPQHLITARPADFTGVDLEQPEYRNGQTH
jgi:hypothetical protein